MNDIQLENLNTSLEDLCCLLVPLFYKTGCKYSCSRTKIGNLLSILAFKYVIDGKKLFNETIYKYDNCGTAITEIIDMLETDEYSVYLYQDDKEYISDELLISAILPERWQRIPQLSFEIMRDTLEVFRVFGAYSKSDLSEILNPISEKATNVSYGKIELSKIPSIIDEIDQNNVLVKYLKTPFSKNGCITSEGVKVKIKK